MPTRQRTQHALVLLLAAVSLVLFILLLVAVAGGHTRALDTAVYEYARGLWGPPWVLIATIITHFFSWFALIPIVGLLTAFLLRRGNTSTVFVLLGASTLGYLTELFTKSALQTPRPPLAAVDVSTVWSFPSGHTIIATIVFGVLCFLALHSLHTSWKRYLAVALCLGGVLLVALSRVFLGAHWLSDVIAGFAVGVFWVTFLASILFIKQDVEHQYDKS